MRLSRKAGLLACGVLWFKFECTENQVHDGTYNAAQTSWEFDDSDQNVNIRYQGYPNYKYEWNASNQRYEYVPVGNETEVTPANPGTVYWINPTTMDRYIVNSDGTYTVHRRTLLTYPNYVLEYPVGDKIGSVRAAKDEYPDAKNGYTYVTLYDGYTIMKDGAGNFYAYTTAE